MATKRKGFLLLSSSYLEEIEENKKVKIEEKVNERNSQKVDKSKNKNKNKSNKNEISSKVENPFNNNSNNNANYNSTNVNTNSKNISQFVSSSNNSSSQFSSDYFYSVPLPNDLPTSLICISNDEKSSNNSLIKYFSLSGFCTITLIKGPLTIDGFTLFPGESYSVRKPSWQPALSVTTQGITSKKANEKISLYFQNAVKNNLTQKNKNLTKDIRQKIKSLNLSSFSTCFVFQGQSFLDQEWLIRIEDQSIYNNYYNKSLGGNQIINGEKWLEYEAYSVKSAIFSSPNIINSLSIEPMVIPNSWIDKFDSLCNSYSNGHTTRALICGAKGTGKSSSARYLVNKILSCNPEAVCSLTKSDPLSGCVCLIDCDLGQPELSIPGSVSLHVLREPILSSVHLNLRKPEYTIFIGDITSKNEPDIFSQAIQQIIHYYYNLCFTLSNNSMENVEENIKSTLFSSNKNIFQSNNSSIFKVENSSFITKSNSKFSGLSFSDSEEDEDEMTNKIMKKIFSTNLPLIVNTDGNIRYMGAEIISIIAQFVKPTHIFHLYETENPSTNNRDNYNSITNQEHKLSLNNLILQSFNSDNKTAKKIIQLKPGKTTPSKTHASDLRNLRLVSHFLRYFPLELSPFNILNPNPFEGSLSTIESSSRTPDCLYLKNATIVGSDNGALSLALLKIPPYFLPFQKVIFNCLNNYIANPTESLSYSNFLKILNGSLVGISILNKDFVDGLSIFNSLDSVTDNYELTPSLTFTSSFCLPACNAVGLIRCIDIERKGLILISPESLPLNSESVIIITISKAIQLHGGLLHGFGWPVYPYFSSEVAGEGAIQSRSRPNLKRKSGK